MTYCLGFKARNHVFLISDSVTTSGDKPQIDRSSFGELSFEYDRLCSEESGHKVYKFSDYIITGAGRVDGIKEFIRTLENRRKHVEDIQRAFEETCQSFLGAECPSFEILIGTILYGVPALLSFNRSRNARIEQNELVELGRGARVFSRTALKLVETVKANGTSADQMISFMLGGLQSVAVRDYILPERVGGILSGAYIGDEGPHWQPDMYYLVPEGVVASEDTASARIGGFEVFAAFRENILFVGSTYFGGISAYKNSVDELNEEAYKKQVFEIAPNVRAIYDRKEFFSVALISILPPTTAVIEMKYALQRPDFGFLDAKSDQETYIQRVGFSKELSDYLCGVNPVFSEPSFLFLAAEETREPGPVNNFLQGWIANCRNILRSILRIISRQVVRFKRWLVHLAKAFKVGLGLK